MSTSAFEGLPDIAVTHLINLLFEPVLLLALDVPFLLVDELLLVSLSPPPFFTANAEITSPPLYAVVKDTAVMIARIISVLVTTLFVYIELTTL